LLSIGTRQSQDLDVYGPAIVCQRKSVTFALAVTVGQSLVQSQFTTRVFAMADLCDGGLESGKRHFIGFLGKVNCRIDTDTDN
jgi:hydrogenase maturation factor HypE